MRPKKQHEGQIWRHHSSLLWLQEIMQQELKFLKLKNSIINSINKHIQTKWTTTENRKQARTNTTNTKIIIKIIIIK